MSVRINFALIADKAFNNILGSNGFVREGVVYKYDAAGKETATDVPEKAIKDEMDKVRNEIQYKTEREDLYPPVVEQLDQLWHGMNADAAKRIEPFYSNIKAVKDKFPKDGSNNTPLEPLLE